MDEVVFEIAQNTGWPTMLPVAQFALAHIADAATELEYYT
jgi:hypothetical protein